VCVLSSHAGNGYAFKDWPEVNAKAKDLTTKAKAKDLTDHGQVHVILSSGRLYVKDMTPRTAILEQLGYRGDDRLDFLGQYEDNNDDNV